MPRVRACEVGLSVGIACRRRTFNVLSHYHMMVSYFDALQVGIGNRALRDVARTKMLCMDANKRVVSGTGTNPNPNPISLRPQRTHRVTSSFCLNINQDDDKIHGKIASMSVSNYLMLY